MTPLSQPEIFLPFFGPPKERQWENHSIWQQEKSKIYVHSFSYIYSVHIVYIYISIEIASVYIYHECAYINLQFSLGNT